VRESEHTYKRRSRGLEFDRLSFFTDAVFAISMTLLVVSLDPPTFAARAVSDTALLSGVWDDFPRLFSFFLAFLLLGRYWIAHHTFYASLDRIDDALIGWSLVYLAFVAFLPFPTDLLGEFDGNGGASALFALNMGIISALEVAMFRRAHHAGLMRNKLSQHSYRFAIRISTVPVVMFLISIPIAFAFAYLAQAMWVASLILSWVWIRRAPNTTREEIRRMSDDAD